MRCGILVVVALLLAATPAWAAWPHDPLANLQVAPSASAQTYPSIVADGAGGALIAWMDNRSGNGSDDIYVQHVTATGAVAPGWPAGGLAICTASGEQWYPVAVADGAGGALVAWADGRPGSQRDIYVQRVTGAGTIAAGWPVNGRQVSSDPHDETLPVICSDGAHGALIGWTFIYTNSIDYDVYGAHVDSAGTVVWSSAVANPTGIQDSPAIAADGAGGAVFVFRDNLSGNDDIKAVRRSAAGGVVYNVPVCSATGNQDYPRIICDGTGAATMTWIDSRSGGYDIYAMRLTPGGAIAPGWAGDGNIVCAETGTQYYPLIATDGGQGSYIVWADDRYGGGFDLFLVRLTPGGVPYPGWPGSGGALICSAPFGQVAQDLTADGSGGVIVSFVDGRVDNAQDIYALRIAGNETLGPGWTSNGVAVCAAPEVQDGVRACVDAAGNAILAWQDQRSGQNAVFAQRVDVFGQLGNPEPSIAKIRDVLADQGGRVRVDWNASWLDAYPTGSISEYWLWRQAPAAQAQLAIAHGAQMMDPAALAGLPHAGDAALAALASRGLYTRTSVNATTYTWEFVSAQPASGFPSYSDVVETTTDSTGGHNYRTAFMVQARGASGGFWNSAPDSGYSVDNLPPVAPAPFLAAYSGGATHLHWGANTEADLFGYRLYRGASSGFVPGAGNLVSAQPDTGYIDPGAAGSWYKLSAVDVHGNESVFAVLGPAGTTAVDGGSIPHELAFTAPAPNPARTATDLGFALPEAARVTLAIYDAGGRRVRALVDGIVPAGVHAQSWSLADDGGRPVADGIYFARFDAQGRSFVRRIAVMR